MNFTGIRGGGGGEVGEVGGGGGLSVRARPWVRVNSGESEHFQRTSWLDKYRHRAAPRAHSLGTVAQTAVGTILLHRPAPAIRPERVEG